MKGAIGSTVTSLCVLALFALTTVPAAATSPEGGSEVGQTTDYNIMTTDFEVIEKTEVPKTMSKAIRRLTPVYTPGKVSRFLDGFKRP